MEYIKKGTAVCLLAALLLVPTALSESADERIEALEARVAALEAQIRLLLETEAEPAQEPEKSIPSQVFELNGKIALEENLYLTVRGFESGDRFRYYPSGGIMTSTLSAKDGYRLLCVYVTVQNDQNVDFYTSTIMDITVSVPDGYSTLPRNTFFYLTNKGVYAGGLKSIGPRASVDGCLLFAIPEDADNTASLTLTLTYGGTDYECALTASSVGSLLPDVNESEQSQF